MSKFGFVIAHICMSLWFLYLYIELMGGRRMIRVVSGEDSLRGVGLLIIACNIIGICITMKRHRTWYAVMLHTLMGYTMKMVLRKLWSILIVMLI